MMKIAIFLILIGFVSCTNSEEKNRIISSETLKTKTQVFFYPSHKPKKANAPFSDAVQVGNTFYLSGQIGMNHDIRELVSGGIEAETKQTLKNIEEVLTFHGLKLENVVKATVILSTMEDFSIMNTVYESYFQQKPARTTFAASGLASGAKIEIEVVAIKN